ncbi:MAG: M15 family metallopeptidase [Mycobacteriales bacterium]
MVITRRDRRVRAAVVALACAGLTLQGGQLWAAERAEPPPSTARGGYGERTTSPAMAPTPMFAGRLLVYVSHGFTPATVAKLRAVVYGPITGVYGGEVYVASPIAGYPQVPVQAFTTNPADYAAAAGRPWLAQQLAAGLIFSRSGARLRHVSVGDTLRMADGRRLPVAAVVDDHLLGGYEMAGGPRVLPELARRPASYLLLADGGDPRRTAEVFRRTLSGRRVRVKANGDNGYMSSIDTVLTQAQVKLRFGEFAMRVDPGTDGAFVPDPGWTSRWIVTSQVPQLGDVKCNRAIVDDLTAAMAEVTARGLGRTVHSADFVRQGGCYNPRLTRVAHGVSLSAHSWGIAVDINVDANPLGAPPRQDTRLVAIMASHGFSWGGRWLRPDGAHFEWVGAGAPTS